MTRRLLPALALLLGLASAEAQANPAAPPAMAQARKAYLNMEYEEVVRLTLGPSRDPSQPTARRVEALELLGLSQLILDRKADARASFEALLTLSPEHKLQDPSGSPKLQRFFEGVRQEVGATPSPGGSLKITPERPRQIKAGRSLTLRVRLQGDRAGMAQAMLRWRASFNPTWRGVPLTVDQTVLSARLQLPPLDRGYQLLYQIELRSAAGNLLARAGTNAAPLKLEVSPGEALTVRPVWKRWWFWTVIGAVVAGGVTTGAVLLTQEGAPTGNLEPGVVQLR